MTHAPNHLAKWLTALTLGLGACQAEPPASLEGQWLSRGYGFFLEAAEGRLLVKEVTAISCIPWDEPLARAAEEADGSWQIQVGGDPSGAFFRLDSGSVARLERTGTASDILFDRVAEAPEVCSRVVEATPLSTFDVFWTTFREHYPFFEMKGVDWDSVRGGLRPQISDGTEPEELFKLLSEAVAPLEDMHTSIFAEDLGRAMYMRPDPELDGMTSAMDAFEIVEPRFARAVEIIESTYLGGQLRSFCNGHLRYGRLPGDIAYLYLDQEGDYTDATGFEASLAVLEAALDTVFRAAEGANGLILDVRKNYGGSDIFSLAVAARLTTTPYRAYAKVARADPTDPTALTDEQPRTVSPSERPGFAGPVVQLIVR